MNGRLPRRWGVVEGYQRWAEELLRQPTDHWERGDAPWLAAAEETLAGWLAAAPGERWLDAGCGTGSWAARLAAERRAVGALDRNRTLLALAYRGLTTGGVPCRGLAHPDAPQAPLPPDQPLSAVPLPAPMFGPEAWPLRPGGGRIGCGAIGSGGDGARGMLNGEEARRQIAFEGPVGAPGTVTLRWGWLEAAPFPGDHFHGVVAAFSLGYVAALETAAYQLSRVLRPGGRLLILDQDPDWELRTAAAAGAPPALTLPYGADARDALPGPPPEVEPLRIATYPRPLAEQLDCFGTEGFRLVRARGWSAAGTALQGPLAASVDERVREEAGIRTMLMLLELAG